MIALAPQKEPETEAIASQKIYSGPISMELLRACNVDPYDLTRTELRIFAYATKFQSFVRSFKIPAAKIIDRAAPPIIVEEEIEERVPRTAYKIAEKPSHTPSDDLEIANLSSYTQIPALAPTEWIYEDLDSAIFDKRLVSRESLVREWRANDRVPYTTYDTIKKIITKEVPAPKEYLRQHYFVLLDISGSMTSDDKAALAAGLSLAFLYEGYRTRAILTFAGFDGRMHEAATGVGEDTFRTLAQAILRESFNGGNTAIQYALSEAAKNIRLSTNQGAHILLISDGLSELYNNPLGDIKLHTCLVQSRYEQAVYDRTVQDCLATIHREATRTSVQQAESKLARLTALKEWSKTYDTFLGEEDALNDWVKARMVEGCAIPSRCWAIQDKNTINQLIEEIDLSIDYTEKLGQDDTAKQDLKAAREALARRMLELIEAEREEAEQEAQRQRALVSSLEDLIAPAQEGLNANTEMPLREAETVEDLQSSNEESLLGETSTEQLPDLSQPSDSGTSPKMSNDTTAKEQLPKNPSHRKKGSWFKNLLRKIRAAIRRTFLRSRITSGEEN